MPAVILKINQANLRKKVIICNWSTPAPGSNRSQHLSLQMKVDDKAETMIFVAKRT